jgi:hypothetical protein
MRTFNACFLAVSALSACTANDVKQTEGALVTTSALLVALPLIPFAEAYHALNDTNGKARANGELWRKTFEPIYSERTALIKKRDPAADAQTAAAQKHIAFLPSIPGAGFYPGVEQEAPNTDRSSNTKTIQNSDFLSYLQTLMDDDPKDKNEKEIGYRSGSAVYKEFQAASWRYKFAFNRETAALKPSTS